MSASSYSSQAQIQYLTQLLDEIARGALQVPVFQRGLVWTQDQRLDLLRSVHLGLPIGSILIWRTRRSDIRCRERLGPHRLPAPAEGEGRAYLLDGHQRLSTLFGALYPWDPAIPKGQEAEEEPEPHYYYRLDALDFALREQASPERTWLPLSLLRSSVRLLRFQRGLGGLPDADRMVTAADELAEAVRTYQLPVLTIATDDLERAALTFQRINTAGTPMGSVDILTALTYRSTQEQDLREQVAQVQRALGEVGWEGFPDEGVVLAYRSAAGLDLHDAQLERVAARIVAADPPLSVVTADLMQAARFLREQCGVDDPQLLPYVHQAVLLAEVLRLQGAAPLPILVTERLASWLFLSTDWEVFTDIDGVRLSQVRAYVQALGRGEEPAWPVEVPRRSEPLPRRFDRAHPRCRALLLRLLALRPCGPQGEWLDAPEAIHDPGMIMYLFSESEVGALVHSPGNVFLMPPAFATRFQHALTYKIWLLEERVLQSHHISDTAREALERDDKRGFVRARQQDLETLLASFFTNVRRDGLGLPGEGPTEPPPERPRGGLLLSRGLTQVDGFFRAYQGTQEAPVPFGGRDESLAELEAWLEEPQQPYALVVAEAGRGKSALLVRFAQQVSERGQAAVVFVPVSIRFSTAQKSIALRLWLEQIQRLRGLDVNLPPDEPALQAEIRDQMQQAHKSGLRLLVIVDGVDEVVGADPQRWPLPAWPGTGVKVLLAARELADRDADRWEKWLGIAGQARMIGLPPMGAAAVRSVLRGALGTLADEREAVATLLRATEGEPLLLRLYVEALHGKEPEELCGALAELAQAPPGLTTYMDRFWRELADELGSQAPLREVIQQVLDALAFALGPLLQTDLLALLVDVDAGTLRLALKSLERLVIGDAEQQGYVLSHPRLRGYFLEQMTASAQAGWRERYLEYCRNQHQFAGAMPTNVSWYVVLHYGQHLDEARAERSLYYKLVSHGWMRVWETQSGTLDGYVEDVARAWRMAEAALLQAQTVGERREALRMECRCALLQASVIGRSSNVPPRLLAALVKQELWSSVRALAYARRVPDSEQRTRALVELAPLLEREDLEEAHSLALRLTGDQKARALVAMYLSPQADRELRREVLSALITTVQGGQVYLETIDRVLEQLSPEDLWRFAEGARQIASMHYQLAVLRRFAERLHGDTRDQVLAWLRVCIEAVLKEGGPAGTEATALSLWLDLAEHVSGSEQRRAVQMALAASQGGSFLSDRARLLEAAIHLSEAEQRVVLEQAIAVLSQASAAASQDFFWWISAPLAQTLVQRGYGTQVLELLLAGQSGPNVHYVLAKIAPYLDDPLQARAIEVLRKIGVPLERARALRTLAEHTKTPDRWQLLEEYLELAFPGLTAELSDEVLVHPRLRAKALELAESVVDVDQRISALAAVAPCLSGAQQQRVLKNLVEGLESRWGVYSETVRVLDRIAPHLTPQQLVNATQMAHRLWDHPGQSRVFASFAILACRRGNANGVLTLAKSRRYEGNHYWRSAGLATLIPHLPEVHRSEIQQWIWDDLKGMNAIDQALVLSQCLADVPDAKPESWLDTLRTIANDERSSRHRQWILAELYASLLRSSDATSARAELLVELASGPAPLDSLLAGPIARVAPLLSEEQVRGELTRQPSLALLARLAELGYGVEALERATGIQEGWLCLRPYLGPAEREAQGDRWREWLIAWAEQKVSGANPENISYQVDLTALAPVLAELPLEELIPIWHKLLRVSATQPRSALLADLQAAPLILAALAGDEILLDLPKLVFEIASWIP